jgi:uncharacterized protein YkwD
MPAVVASVVLALSACGGGAPLGDAEVHFRAGRLERAAELLVGHEGPDVEALRGRIERRARERAEALAHLEHLRETRDERDPKVVLEELRRLLTLARDPVVKERTEIELSAAHDWSVIARSGGGRRVDAGGTAVQRPERAAGPAPLDDPLAAAAVRAFESAVRDKNWVLALDLAERWSKETEIDPALGRSFAEWGRNAHEQALAESDALVVRALQLEEQGDRVRALALLAEAAPRFPGNDEKLAVARTLAELRGDRPRPGLVADGRDRATPHDRSSDPEPRPAPPPSARGAGTPAEGAPSGDTAGEATASNGRGPGAGERPAPSGPTAEELAALRAAEEAQRQARLAVYKDAGERLATLDAPAIRDAAFAELAAAGENSAAAREVLAGALQERFRRVVRSVERAGHTAMSRLERVAERRRDLDAAREKALALIFDEVRYFYPYKPPHVSPEKAATYDEVQREVDRLVEAVDTIWTSNAKAKVPEVLRTAAEELAWLRARQRHVPDRFVLPGDVPAWVEGLPDREEVDISTFAWTRAEARALARDRAISAWNEARWAQYDQTRAEELEEPVRIEREQVRITNGYRALMGRPLLAWHPSLHQAAKGHSVYMNTTGDFGHHEPHPATRTPFDRMRAVGYLNGISENCHVGSGDALGAHRGWVRSSGHHRNLLMPGHKEMASAVVGGYWTQNFGLDTGFEAQLDLSGWRD